MSQFKELLNDRERLNKFNLFTVYLFVFTIPLGLIFSLKAMALWMFSSLLLFRKQDLLKTRHKLYIGLSIFYIFWHIVAIFYSTVKGPAAWLVAKKFYIAVFPILFISVADLYKKHYDKILSFYVLGSLTAVILMFGHALANSIQITENGFVFNPFIYKSDDWLIKLRGNHFVYAFLSYFKHPMYMSAQLIFALAVLSFLKRNRLNLELSSLTKLLVSKPIFIFLFIVFTITVFLLESRTNLLSIVVLYILLILTSKIKFKWLYATLFLIIGLAFILLNPRTLNYIEEIRKGGELSEQKKEAVYSRLYFWKSAYTIIRQHPIFGVGTGDLQPELYKIYAKQGLVRFLSSSYNTHNEFLENLGQMGIVGFSGLAGMLLYAFAEGIRRKNYLLLFFIILETINFTFEVPLCRLDGIVFFSYFLNFLLLLDFEQP